MQRLAHFLDIDVHTDLMPTLVAAASFKQMKKNADRLAPNAHKGIWLENSQLLNKG